MNFRWQIDKQQVFIVPAIGYINEKYYYGYPVIAFAFAWLTFRCKVEFGVKKRGKSDG